jgi:uncharacterized protein (TIRG00374 family)
MGIHVPGEPEVMRRRLKQAFVVVVLGVAAVFLAEKRHQLLSGLRLLIHPDYPFLIGALAAQALSVLALARLQWLFLRAGDVDIGTTEMAELTVAHNAITMSVPGGVAWSTAFLYDQLRRRGANRTLAGWAILVSGALSSFCLFLLLVAGVEWAHRGPTVAAQVPVALLAAIPPVGVVVVVILHTRGVHYTDAVDWFARRASRWAKISDWVRRTGKLLRRFQPSTGEWVRAFVLSLTNWVLDLGCLMLCTKTLGLAFPWPGVLVAYALGKVAGMLPITPGGLGVVEAGLTGLLVVYGLPAPKALAATLMYRLISFWALLPPGWGYWGFLKLRERRGNPARA